LSQYIVQVIDKVEKMRDKLKWVLIECFGSFVIAVIVYFALRSILWAGIVFCVLLVLILIQPALLVLNKLVKRTNWYQSQLADGSKFRKDISCDLDICNLGSNSGKYAFDYHESGLKGENWAIGPQTLSYDFRVLKNYFSYLKEDATVLIPICPFSSCIKDFEDEAVNHKYYSFLHPVLILNFSKATRDRVMRFVNTPFQLSPFTSTKRLIRDIPYIDTQKAIEDEALLEEDAESWLKSWKNQFMISDLDAPVSEPNLDSIKYNMLLLSEMISFCLDRNLHPVVVLPPVTRILSSRFSETFRENYIYSFVRDAIHEDIPFLNYLDDNKLSDLSLYFNAYFLNKKGSKLFTKQVLTDLHLI
jgi:hypothetical protein